MGEESRKNKFGQFGYGKYIYQKDGMDELKAFFLNLTGKHFPNAGIAYFV